MSIIFQPLSDCSNKCFKSGQPGYPFTSEPLMVF